MMVSRTSQFEKSTTSSEHSLNTVRVLDELDELDELDSVRPDEMTWPFHAMQYGNLRVVLEDLLAILGVRGR